ncbi:MAG: tripartite tricarboxylate transporter TctB family protein [Spirochaetales bacterium]|nr:tripartite tricarboxylate transporter TctB family protein [Spirochaetales bacterium]
MWKRFLREWDKAGGTTELLIPLFVSAWFIYIFIDSFKLKQFVSDVTNSGMMPRYVSGFGMFFMIITLVPGIRRFVTGIRKPLEENDGQKTKKGEEALWPGSLWSGVRKNKEYVSLIFILIYILLMTPLGFIISSALFLFFDISFVMPKKKYKFYWIALLAVVFPTGIYFIFYEAFAIMLPSGILENVLEVMR